MASNSGHTIATASNTSNSSSEDIFSSDVWAFVDCCRCHADILVPDPANAGDPGATALRTDFTLLGCGHILCNQCFQAVAECPNCKQSIQDGISVPVSTAQTNPAIGQYFRPIPSMLNDFSGTINFQINMLRDRASYYQAVVTRQKKVLSTVRTELSELREMKKQFEALSRENAALKAQLGGTNPPMPMYQQQAGYNPGPSRSGRSTPIVQHAAAPIQSIRRSATSTPAPQQHLQNMQAPSLQQHSHPPPVMRSVQVPSRSSMVTPHPEQSSAAARAFAKSVPPSASRKRPYDDLASDARRVSHRRISESALPQGGISSADHHAQVQAEPIQREPPPRSNSIEPSEFRSRFINPNNPVGSLDKYGHPSRSKRIDLNHTLQTIPESAPCQQRRPPRAEVDEYADYYDDGDQLFEQEIQQPANTGNHGGQQYRREDYPGFQTAGQYKPDQVQRAVPVTATKQSSFKPVMANKTNIPSQPNHRSYQPTNAGHGRPASRSGHIGGIQPMSGNFGAPPQPVRSPPRARLAGSGQGGQQNRANGQFGSKQGSQAFKYQRE